MELAIVVAADVVVCGVYVVVLLLLLLLWLVVVNPYAEKVVRHTSKGYVTIVAHKPAIAPEQKDTIIFICVSSSRFINLVEIGRDVPFVVVVVVVVVDVIVAVVVGGGTTQPFFLTCCCN